MTALIWMHCLEFEMFSVGKAGAYHKTFSEHFIPRAISLAPQSQPGLGKGVTTIRDLTRAMSIRKSLP